MHRYLGLGLCLAGLGFGMVAVTNPRFSKPAPGFYADGAEALSPEEERARFHLPPGFVAELVAAEPQIHKPVNLAFDDRGRLWVTDTVEYPFFAPADRPGRDTVKVLESTQGDGTFDKVTTFADGLNVPAGVLPLAGGHAAIVHSMPNLWRLTDTDGDGVADRREVVFGPNVFHDTHGLPNGFTWGYDGWVYACHGYNNVSTFRAGDGSQVTLESGNTFRFTPDGGRVEQVTHGQVNPFGLCFDPRGDLYSADSHTRPVMLLLRGGCYECFGKPHDGLGFAPEMCDHDHGSTGIAGVAYYAADRFPWPYRDNVFVGNVVTGRINRDRLERTGSTWRAVEMPDLLTSDDPWFRPVDVKLGPDGALYVADFYNRIIAHYEVPHQHPGRDRERGRIWRIRYAGHCARHRAGNPLTDWTQTTVGELVTALGDPNLTVRTLAANQLAARGTAVAGEVSAALRAPPAVKRVHALWVLERLGLLGDAELTAALADAEPVVRTHAYRLLGERREVVLPRLCAGLRDPDPFVRRAAADALGRHPDAANVGPLLEAHRQAPAADANLRHTLRIALRNQLRDGGAYDRLPAPLADGDLTFLAEASLGLPAAPAAAFLARHLDRLGARPDYLQHVARFGGRAVQGDVTAAARKAAGDDLGRQVAAFEALHQGHLAGGAALEPEARQWAEELTARLLASGQPDHLDAGLRLAHTLRLAAAVPALKSLALGGPDAARRAAAGEALLAIDPDGALPLVGRLVQETAEPPGLRERLAVALAGLNRPGAHAVLMRCLPEAPARLQSALAVGLADSPQGAALLLDAVAAGRASPRLLLERPVRARLEQRALPGLAERIAALTHGLTADQAVQGLIDQRRAGFQAAHADAQAGARVFAQHCTVCHQIGGQGAKVGPQLDGIGHRGLDRLLEDTLDPDRNVEQGFRVTTLALDDGRLLTGLVLREEGEVLVLADAQGKEQRIARARVERRATLPLSPMPANVARELPEEEYYHLLAFLLAQRTAAAGR